MKLPDFAAELFNPWRYKVLYGGRGSGKSYSIARILLTLGASKKKRVLCAREFQNSISESVHKLLEEQIIELNLEKYYTVTQNRIYSDRTGTEFFFKGVRMNVDSIKSMQGITDLWLEEAQMVSQRSWDILVPTVRQDGSEIWVSFNPENEDDPTYKNFVGKGGDPIKREGAYIRKVDWNDNPWFPKVLSLEKDHMYKTNADLAGHVWGGDCRSQSDAQVFKGKYIVDYFDIGPHVDGPYYGADWGFSVDPTCLVQVYVDANSRHLLIRRETSGPNGGVGVEMNEIPELFDQIPGSRERLIRADCARPETISYVRNKGFNIEGVSKWPGSVEDGIEFMKSFDKIIIHPDCPFAKTEFKNYSYKVDRLTQDVTTIIVDAWNHRIDAIRYALTPLITSEVGLLDVL